MVSTTVNTLSFSRSEFLSPSFSPINFYLDRKNIDLHSLKKELCSTSFIIKNELVELVNKDYEDFIALSINLKDVDDMLESLSTPLDEIKLHVENVMTLQELIQTRMDIKCQKETLTLCLGIQESIEKLEKFMSSSHSNTMTELDKEALERVATEYNQLKFLLSKGKELPFVIQLESKISYIEGTLKEWLSIALKGAFTALQGEKTKENQESLLNLCRTCVLLDKISLVSSIFRDTLLDPFVLKIVQAEPNDFNISKLYSTFLQYVRQDLDFYIQLTRSSYITCSCNILSEAIWPSLIDGILQNLIFIFNPGLTREFHQNYKETIAFTREFEEFYDSLEELLALRRQSSYTEFLKRWQLSVYFQIVSKDIVTEFESVFNQSLYIEKISGLYLNASHQLMHALKRVWSDDVYLIGLEQRCCKLCFQFIYAFAGFIQSRVLSFSLVPDSSHSSHPSDSSQVQIQIQVQPQSMEKEKEMEELFCKTFSDIFILEQLLFEFISTQISSKLGFSKEIQNTTLDCFKESWDTVTSLTSGLSDWISNIYIKKCIESLSLVKNIPAQYRHTNKEVPTKPSFFIPLIFKPWMEFISCLEPNLVSLVDTWNHVIVQQVANRYADLLVETLKSSDYVYKRFKKKVIEQGITDEEKIRMQMSIDVDAFIQEAKVLNVELDKSRLINVA